MPEPMVDELFEPVLPLLAPCCQKPLPLKSVNEVAIVVVGEPEPGWPTTYGWNSRCCQSLYEDRNELLAGRTEAAAVLHERKILISASVSGAYRAEEERHEKAIQDLRVLEDAFRSQQFALMGEETCGG